MAQPSIFDMSPEQLQRGIVNLDGQLEAADAEIETKANRRAELARDRAMLEALLARKVRETASTP